MKKYHAALRNWLIGEANGYSVTFRHFPECMKCDSRATCSSAFLLAPGPCYFILALHRLNVGDSEVKCIQKKKKKNLTTETNCILTLLFFLLH